MITTAVTAVEVCGTCERRMCWKGRTLYDEGREEEPIVEALLELKRGNWGHVSFTKLRGRALFKTA